MMMRRRRVYPRVCGGTLCIATGASSVVGLIPACAGEPVAPQRVAQGAEVYPRVCGGTGWRGGMTDRRPGLSPRVRGNLARRVLFDSGQRSIPACAGEPQAAAAAGVAGEVYPRVCGGTAKAIPEAHPMRGLSPRVRGEPELHRPHRRRPRVYPRVCGGTATYSRRRLVCLGLSPRVRGNPSCPPHWTARGRSIPACAGEPRCGRFAQLQRQVYPRVCGGTTAGRYRPDEPAGLSPRVRGNQGRRRCI